MRTLPCIGPSNAVEHIDWSLRKGGVTPEEAPNDQLLILIIDLVDGTHVKSALTIMSLEMANLVFYVERAIAR